MAEGDWVDVLWGSERRGPGVDLATWTGLEVPEDRWDDYVDLVGFLDGLEGLFADLEHGVLEVLDEDPTTGDVPWVVLSDDPPALRHELRDKLIRELSLDLRLSMELLELARRAPG